jgi:hypothetical protein
VFDVHSATRQALSTAGLANASKHHTLFTLDDGSKAQKLPWPGDWTLECLLWLTQPMHRSFGAGAERMNVM